MASIRESRQAGVASFAPAAYPTSAMQRDRLEGWMVRQIAQADLAKETVIQIPTRAATAPPTAGASGGSSTGVELRSPRRRFLGRTAVQRPHSTPTERHAQPSAPLSPGDRIRQHRASPRTRLESAAAVVGEIDGEGSVARQWRLHFQDPDQSFREDGRVDRSKVLKGLSPRRVEGTIDGEWEGEDGENATADDLFALPSGRDWGEGASPLTLRGMPREYILEYIRQSAMPTAWTTHARFTGEWEAVPPSEADGRYVAKDADDASTSAFSSSLPPLGSRSRSQQQQQHTVGSPIKSPRASVQLAGSSSSASPSRGYRRPHPGATVATPTSPRLKTPRRDERIQRVLAELRAEPTAWEAFQKDAKQYLDDQRRRQHESNKIRENKQRAAQSPRAPSVLADRKRRNDERLGRTQQHRRLLIQREDARLEAKLLEYRRRTQTRADAASGTKGGDARDPTTSVAYRRRKTWLLVVAFAVATTRLQARLVGAKQRQVLERMQSKAARVIQRLWKKWKWRHASQQTVVVYTWLRKCLWKLLFKLRCRRKRRLATVLQRFMLDQCSGSRETRNFNRMMLKWRGKVIVSQRLGLAFVLCARARLAALSIWWDALDHERQRGERQLHERLLPATDEKEAEWHALVGGRGGALRPQARRQSSNRALSVTTTTSTAAHTTVASTAPAATASSATVSSAAPPPLLGGGSLSRRSVSTRHLLGQMDERLTTMQQVMTPFEIQRLQQHAFHVVKIPKAIKTRLLHEMLAASRTAFMQRLTEYEDRVASASYAREVKLDDARAIVQGGASWGSLLVDAATGQPKLRRPAFRLYAGDAQRRLMEELVRRGVQLTLESDPEQRAIVERQRQRRLAFDTDRGSIGGSAPRKREGPAGAGGASAAVVPLPPSASGGGAAGPKTTRKLTFAIPATIKEKTRK